MMAGMEATERGGVEASATGLAPSPQFLGGSSNMGQLLTKTLDLGQQGDIDLKGGLVLSLITRAALPSSGQYRGDAECNADTSL